MKKDKCDDLVAHFHLLGEQKKLEDEVAKQQKRLWLRTRIHEIIGISDISSPIKQEIFEEVFDWIYQAPIYEWEGMLYCYRHEAKVCTQFGEYNKALKEAKKLYSFLK